MKPRKHGSRQTISGVSDNWQVERAKSDRGTQLLVGPELRGLPESAIQDSTAGAQQEQDSSVKRNSLPGVSAPQVYPLVDQRGVGARQTRSAPAGRGGGYQDNRCVLNFDGCPCESRLAELCKMGLSAPLMRAAAAIGVDAFLILWRILDSDPSLHTEKGDIELHLRPFRSYLRYQRNRYIEALVEQGFSVTEIRDKVRRMLCERISLRHISRIATGN